ncbi:MAG: hypothetical protein GX230_10565, partial [Lentisphaerae bacterium]|nr:hypothetical protein [Lentisphaerota bacterium]
HNAKIGGYSDSVGTKGLIYDMRLWDYARSRSEIAAQALLPPNCRIPGGAVGMWRLDEGEGGTAGDGNVFNPVTGILKNNATWVDATLPVLYASGENLTIGAQSHPYGAPTPPYGVVEGLEQGSNFVCSVTAEPQYLAADGRCRGVCSGYLWYTNAACAPVAGSGNSFDYSHESSYPMSLLVWQWENQYEIEITAGVGGSVTTGTSWLAPDTTVTTTAVPDESARFLYWAGDVTGEQRYATTITVTSDVPKAVEARFTFESPVQYVAPTGSDGNDGLSWATAKRGINAAFDSLAESGVIYMAGGNYPLTQTISFEGRSDVKILGGYAGVSSDETPGARDSKKWPTELDGQAAQRVIYLTGSSRIEFEGLTIANGRVSTGFGGGVEVSASSGIIFSDCLIARNYGGTSASGGGIALRSGAVVTITNSMVRNNDIQLAATPARYGGGIYVASGTTLLLVDTIVAGNLLYAAYSRYGGGIYSEGNLTMKNCLIAGNSVSGSGDGVLIGGGTATIESSSIVDNGGQGLRRNSGTLNVINSIVYGNGNNLIGSANVSYCNIEGYAPNEVSGIIDVPPLFERDYYLAPESLCRSAGSGTAESRGLGDYTTQVDGTAAADAVVDLGYHHRGGYALEAADIYVSAAGDDSDGSSWAKAYHSVSRALDEARDGTHIYLAAEKFTVAGESFPLQIIDKLGVVLLGAAEAGSVIDATGSGQRVMDMGHSAGILLQDITLRGGQRGGCSGLEIIGGGGITLRRCKVIDNYSTSNNNGGGLSVSGITLSIYDSLITNNFVTGSTTIAYKGGGFFAAQGVSEIWHSVISGNRIVGGYAHRGGGLAFAGGNHYIGNSLIIGNRSTTSADGVYVESGTVIIENCTVVGNNREAIRNEGKLSITNSIIWGHAAKPALVGTMAVGWSCSEDDLTESGEGNICSDPLFVDAAGGDYTLLENSPCWNAGIDRPWMRGALDLAGNKRRQHDRVDMGAYERQPAPGTVLLLR